MNKFKVGDEVELVSLINTDNDHGVAEGMLNVGDKGFVYWCEGYTVFLKGNCFYYHAQDFRLIKDAYEVNTSQNEENDMFLESDVLLPKNDEDDFTCCLGKGIESDGGSSSYYFTKLPKHLIDQIVETGGIEIKDIIRYVFDNNADAFNIIKAQKRIIEHSKGKGKAGITGLYDAKKITFFANEQYKAMKNKEC